MSQKMFPCTHALCVALSDKSMVPCKIHREFPQYRASQPPVTKADHWKIDDPMPLHDRRSEAPEQQEFFHPDRF